MKRNLFFVLALVSICVMPLYGQNPKTATTGTLNGHEWVDLGLPSGTLWATCNVGAEMPEDYGDYFAWGETQPKDIYNESNYQHCMENDSLLTKYCFKSELGNNGFADTLSYLLPEDDAATVHWGNGWQMPTEKEFEELFKNTTITWTTRNSVNGMLFAANNGNSLFLPVAGVRYENSLVGAGSEGHYWSKSLLNNDTPVFSWVFSFNMDDYGKFANFREYGCSVRPVTSLH